MTGRKLYINFSLCLRLRKFWNVLLLGIFGFSFVLYCLWLPTANYQPCKSAFYFWFSLICESKEVKVQEDLQWNELWTSFFLLFLYLDFGFCCIHIGITLHSRWCRWWLRRRGERTRKNWMKCKEKKNNMPAYRPLLGINESYLGGSRVVE